MMTKYVSCLVCLLLLIAVDNFGQEYYVSNPVGMVLRKVTGYEKNSYPWILEIETPDNGTEVRILYHNNSVERKYVKKVSDIGTVISVWKDGVMTEQTEYIGGYAARESVFKKNGDVETADFVRDGDRLKSVSRFRNGQLLFTDRYVTGRGGRLYQVKRIYPDGREDIFGVNYSEGSIAAEWSIAGNRSSIYYFEDNDLAAVEEYEGKELVSYEIKSGNGREITTGRDLKRDETSIKRYDERNRLVYHEVFGKDKNIVVTYRYSGNRLSEKLIKTPGNREKHIYSYDSGGSLLREDVYVNNVLQKTIKPAKDGREEETLYKNNIPLLKVIIKDGVEISRETIDTNE